MKKLYLLFLLAGLTQALTAQVYVSTDPENKRAILEEFTGTGCPNCPGGHTMAANLLTANPGNLFVIAYHPTNSSYTTNDPMKNQYPNAFYTIPSFLPATGTCQAPSSTAGYGAVWSESRVQPHGRPTVPSSAGNHRR